MPSTIPCFSDRRFIVFCDMMIHRAIIEFDTITPMKAEIIDTISISDASKYLTPRTGHRSPLHEIRISDMCDLLHVAGWEPRIMRKVSTIGSNTYF